MAKSKNNPKPTADIIPLKRGKLLHKQLISARKPKRRAKAQSDARYFFQITVEKGHRLPLAGTPGLPCPFCAHTEVVMSISFEGENDRPVAQAMCGACGATAESAHQVSDGPYQDLAGIVMRAAEQWNQRKGVQS
jgi:hypothetical protein